jgi:predicted P-loop ATPase
MVDIARPAYGHYTVKQKRHSIEVGTTNSDEYLQSQTGNRRWWPLKLKGPIDLEKLRRDRLQLIGEAAKYQADGESVVLPESLWEAAGIEQEKRRVQEPWEDALSVVHKYAVKKYRSADGEVTQEQIQMLHYEDMGLGEPGKNGARATISHEIVGAGDLLEYVLGVSIANQTTAHTMRLSNAMKKLGWERSPNGYVTVNKKRVKGYYRVEATGYYAAEVARMEAEGAAAAAKWDEARDSGL